MTAKKHIEKIGKALLRLRASIESMEAAVEEAKRMEAVLHATLDRAQRAYKQEHDGDNVVELFSGGTDKPPPPPDPEEPVGP